ncbi:Tlg2-vesicle protein [Coniosporium apollinis]|uniref:Golgi apparatus membrane protein TVP38 n=1 Tax=Coniosporium apollinis TaxID=61459 RepID=A0ABQ9P705_9PEZI|nr:Tlg2-vesicle protein [Coniosporium apollinis]
MPPSDDWDIRALAIPIDETPENTRRRSPSPAISRTPLSFRHRSSPTNGPSTWQSRMQRNAEKLQRHALRTYNQLSVLQRVLAVSTGVSLLVLTVLFLVYHDSIFGWLAPAAKRWREVKGGWMILWALVFVVSFPPLIGYSTLLTISGFVYGFPNGWFIVATATILGSTASFLASRSLLKSLVHRLIAHDPRFAALALTLKHDGLKLLIMIRLCPLPYSLSNGAIATFPTVHPLAFMAASAAASPKLLLHVFVGAKLGDIAEKGGSMDAKTKAISYLSIVIGMVAGAATGWIIYRQTKARARELEQLEEENARGSTREQLVREYSDDPGALEAAERLREGEDDISLREAYEEEVGEGYRDESSGSDEDVFGVGDGGGEVDAPTEGRK